MTLTCLAYTLYTSPQVKLIYHHNHQVVCRMFFFLVEINYGPLGAGGGDMELLKRVRAAAHTGLSELRDCVGFNQVGLG